MRFLSSIVASALLGAVLLLAPSAAAQVPGGGITFQGRATPGDCPQIVSAYVQKDSGSPCGAGTNVSSFSAGTTGFTPSSPTTGAVVLSGTLIVANGGTGRATLTAHATLLGNGTGGITSVGPCSTGQVQLGSTGADPVCTNLTSTAVTSLNFGTTGLTPSSATQGAITVAGTLGFANGGTGQTSYTDGQLLIGNTATGGLSKASLTAGANITITPGNGSITIAASGGSGTGCIPAGTITSVLTDSGSGACVSNPAFTYSAGTATLGTAGSVVGTLAFRNATSGTLSLAPPTGALGTVTVTVPDATDTLVNLASVQALTNKTIDASVIGGTTAAAGTFTTVTASGSVSTPQLAQAGTNVAQIVGGGTANTLKLQNRNTGSGPIIWAQGSDTNVDLELRPQGTGKVIAINGAANNVFMQPATNPTIGTSGGSLVFAPNSSAAFLTGNAFTINGTSNPAIIGTDSSRAANSGTWQNYIGLNGAWSIYAANDAQNASTSAYVIARGTTYNVASHTWYTSAVAGMAVQQMQLTSSGLALATALSPGNGGTGQTSYTDGQLLIGNTSGNTLGKATLTAGSGITITNGASSITIAASAGGSAPTFENTAFTAVAGNTYCVDTSGGGFNVTLPASAANGDLIGFVDCAKTWGTNPMVLLRNGLTIMLLAEDLTISTTNANPDVKYVSNGGVTTWFLK